MKFTPDFVRHVTNISTGLEQPVQLTLANQCVPLQDGRSLEFSTSALQTLPIWMNACPLYCVRQGNSTTC